MVRISTQWLFNLHRYDSKTWYCSHIFRPQLQII